MPTYSNGKIKIHTEYVILIPFKRLYKYICDIIEKNKINQQEINVIEILNNIDNQEIHDDLTRLLFVEEDNYVKNGIIRKYNNPEYMSNIYIAEIIHFAMLKNKSTF